MADLNFDDVDTVKAFFTIVLGAAVGALLFYLYASLIRPKLSLGGSGAGSLTAASGTLGVAFQAQGNGPAPQGAI